MPEIFELHKDVKIFFRATGGEKPSSAVSVWNFEFGI
jgi:hypothetical protein